MSNEETHVVLCVLEGAIPDGRIYSELTEAELEIIVEALDSHLDGLIDTKKELWKEDQEPQQKYIEEVATILGKIEDFNK